MSGIRMKQSAGWGLLVALLAVTLTAGMGYGCGTCGCQGHKGAAAGSKAKLSPEAAAAKAKVEAAGVGFLTADALTAKLKSGKAPILIDVLGADSYKQSHLKGAINIPYTKVDAVAPTVLPDKKAEIVVYCGSYLCGASLKAAKALKKLGYTNVHDYKGGLKEWTTLGLPRGGASAKD